MSFKVTKLEKSQIKFTFDVEPEEFTKALDKAFEQEVKNVKIDGFRPGKAPRTVFNKVYGEERLYASAMDFIFEEKVNEILADKKTTDKYRMIGQFRPSFEEALSKEKSFKAGLIVDVEPEVKLPDLTTFTVADADTKVTEIEVENVIKALMKKDAKMEAKADGVIASGDYAKFDFLGKVDGVAFDGGAAEGYELQIGSGQFIPGFEDQMIGMKVGETKDLNVKFPENYGAENLAGKDAVFTVTVHEVKAEILPELTDEYAKTLGVKDAETVAAVKKAKKAELKAAKETSEKDRQFDDIVNEILDATKVELPETMIQERVNAFKAQYEQQAKMYNIPFDKFVEIMGTTMEQFNDQAKRNAERQALFNVVASAIIDENKLAPTKEQLEAKAEEDAAKNGKSKEANLQVNGQKYYSELAYNALVEFLLSTVKKVTKAEKAKEVKAKEAEAKAAEKPAKKTTAKKTTKTEASEEKPAAKKTTTKKATKKDAE